MSELAYKFIFTISWVYHISLYLTFQDPLIINGMPIIQSPYVIVFHLVMMFWASGYDVNIKTSYHVFGILLGLSYFIFMSYIIVNTVVIIVGAFAIHKFIIGDMDKLRRYNVKGSKVVDGNEINKDRKLKLKESYKEKWHKYMHGGEDDDV